MESTSRRGYSGRGRGGYYRGGFRGRFPRGGFRGNLRGPRAPREAVDDNSSNPTIAADDKQNSLFQASLLNLEDLTTTQILGTFKLMNDENSIIQFFQELAKRDKKQACKPYSLRLEEIENFESKNPELLEKMLSSMKQYFTNAKKLQDLDLCFELSANTSKCIEFFLSECFAAHEGTQLQTLTLRTEYSNILHEITDILTFVPSFKQFDHYFKKLRLCMGDDHEPNWSKPKYSRFLQNCCFEELMLEGPSSFFDNFFLSVADAFKTMKSDFKKLRIIRVEGNEFSATCGSILKMVFFLKQNKNIKKFSVEHGPTRNDWDGNGTSDWKKLEEVENIIKSRQLSDDTDESFACACCDAPEFGTKSDKNLKELEIFQDLDSFCSFLKEKVLASKDTEEENASSDLSSCSDQQLKQAKRFLSQAKSQISRSLLLLNEELDGREKTIQCSICCCKPKDTVLCPCGHCICSECNQQLEKESVKKCPICRHEVVETKAVFL